MSKPIVITLIFGLVSGVSILPLTATMLYVPSLSAGIPGFILCNLILYSALLCRWSNTPVTWVVSPLLLAVIAGLFSDGGVDYLLPVLGIFSWIRSGICFDDMPVRSGLAELITISAGGVFLFLLPVSSLSLSLATWFFFLVQTLYFYIVPSRGQNKTPIVEDRFEYAHREAERILDGQ